MGVEQVFSGKKRFLDLLLLADEQEDMLDRYLERGEVFTLYDGGGLRAVCVVTNEGESTYELKNIAIYPESQRKDYGKYLTGFLFRRYPDKCSVMFVGTDDTPRSLSFYQSCRFIPSHRVENFFTDHCDHPICKDGILLQDTVYLKREKL